VDTLLQLMGNAEYNTSEKIFNKLMRLRKIEWEDNPDLKQLEKKQKEAYDFIDEIKLKEDNLTQEEYNSFLQGAVRNDIINEEIRNMILTYLEENNEKAIEERKKEYERKRKLILSLVKEQGKRESEKGKIQKEYNIDSKGNVLANRNKIIEVEVMKCYLMRN